VIEEEHSVTSGFSKISKVLMVLVVLCSLLLPSSLLLKAQATTARTPLTTSSSLKPMEVPEYFYGALMSLIACFIAFLIVKRVGKHQLYLKP
jgi:hypothetical protein